MSRPLLRSWHFKLLAPSRFGNRRFISTPGATPSLQVFNDNVKQIQRERSAVNAEASREVDYLRDEIASRLCERLLVCGSVNA